jgi:hypothetical protein
MSGLIKKFDESNPMVDSSELKLTLVEDKTNSKYLIARGEFGRADIPTQNRRIYPRKIWEREINKVMKAVKQGKVLGMLEHPKDGKTTLEKVSHIITNLELLDDGRIIGEAKVLKNQYGNQVESILAAGGCVGVSSRGLGSTVENDEGFDVVQDDFSYITHDFVVDPAVMTSYPSFVEEEKEGSESSFEQTLNEGDDDMSKKKDSVEVQTLSEDRVKEIVSTELKQLMNGFKNEIIQKLAQLKESTELAHASESAHAPMTEPASAPVAEQPVSPEISPASTEQSSPDAADQVEASDQAADDLTKVDQPADASVETKEKAAEGDDVSKKEDGEKKDVDPAVQESLEKKLEQAVALSERLAMNLEYHKALSESKHQSSFKALVGDVSQYKKMRHLQDVLDRAKKFSDLKKQEENIRVAERKKLIESKDAEIKKLSIQNKKLKEALQEAIDAAKEYSLKLYVEEKIRFNPNAGKVRQLMESKKISTKEECDLLIESFSVATPEVEDYNSIRRRFRVPTTLVENHVKETGGTTSVDQGRSVVEGVDRELEQLLPGQLGEIKSLAEAVSGR